MKKVFIFLFLAISSLSFIHSASSSQVYSSRGLAASTSGRTLLPPLPRVINENMTFAQFNLGVMNELYERGRYEEAFNYAKKVLSLPTSTLSDKARSLERMGDIYQAMGETAENLSRALEKYQNVFALGDKKSLEEALGFRHLIMLRSKIDTLLKIQRRIRSAEHSNTDDETFKSPAEIIAQADAFLNGSPEIAPNHNKALELYISVINSTEKTEQDELNAYTGIADIYLLGTDYVPSDHAKALKYYQKALTLARRLKNKQSETNILVSIGGLYFIGGSGIEKNYAQAIKYYNAALKNADLLTPEVEARTYFYLGDIYRMGQLGIVERNVRKALQNYEMAEQGELSLKDAAKIAYYKAEIYQFLKDKRKALVEARKYKLKLTERLSMMNQLNTVLLDQEDKQINAETISKIKENLRDADKIIRNLGGRIKRITRTTEERTGSDEQEGIINIVPSVEALKVLSLPTAYSNRDIITISDDEDEDISNYFRVDPKDITPPKSWLNAFDNLDDEEETSFATVEDDSDGDDQALNEYQARAAGRQRPWLYYDNSSSDEAGLSDDD